MPRRVHVAIGSCAIAWACAADGPGEVASGTSETTEESGGEPCPGPCDRPPGPCFAPDGECVDGSCAYAPALAGTPCGGESCGESGYCDAMGTCIPGGGDGGECTRPHALGGTCVDGQCGGWTCEAPWDNCDGDWENGCEIPVGVPHQCDLGGLSEDGCFTAWCGQSEDPGAIDFGTWFCFDCTTCRVPDVGQCQWCDHESGQWYPAEACSCGPYEDAACGP